MSQFSDRSWAVAVALAGLWCLSVDAPAEEPPQDYEKGASYQTIGVRDYLPVFSEKLARRRGRLRKNASCLEIARGGGSTPNETMGRAAPIQSRHATRSFRVAGRTASLKGE